MNIEISTDTCNRIERIMRSDETFELVIRRLLDHHTENGDEPVPTPATPTTLPPANPGWPNPSRHIFPPPEAKANARRFGPNNRVSFMHAKILEVLLDGKPIEPKWNTIIRHLVRLVYDRYGEVRENLHPDLRIRKGIVSESGYNPIPEVGVSVAGVDANKGGRIIINLAMMLGLSLEIFFFWRNKQTAMYPGEFGLLNVDAE